MGRVCLFLLSIENGPSLKVGRDWCILKTGRVRKWAEIENGPRCLEIINPYTKVNLKRYTCISNMYMTLCYIYEMFYIKKHHTFKCDIDWCHADINWPRVDYHLKIQSWCRSRYGEGSGNHVNPRGVWNINPGHVFVSSND